MPERSPLASDSILRLDLAPWQPTPAQSRVLKILRVPVNTAKGGRSPVEVYDDLVRRLRWLPVATARLYADLLFGPGAWRDFEFLRGGTS